MDAPKVVVPPATPAQAVPPTKLKLRDRCDRCGSRAYVGAEINGTDLLFCAHHFRRFETSIRAVATEILDERWALDAENGQYKKDSSA